MEIDYEKEKQDIHNAYVDLVKSIKVQLDEDDKVLIKKAFDLAVESHKNMRRKSGEPYIFHPIAVAKICAEEIGLGATSVACALLHDTVEDTDLTLDDIESMFNLKCRNIIDGLTKLSGVFDLSTSSQAENFRKMLLTIPEDIRVILIKIADRLHNMRTLDSMRDDKQLKIASETAFLYAPLAHRLGLYSIKSELDDLALKYTHPDEYKDIESKLEKNKEVRERFIQFFSAPIIEALTKQQVKFSIKGRPKSIYSIWNKVHNKGVKFEEIFDVFAIRIIVDSVPENEKADCWKTYSIVTDFYKPNPERLRDWISHPKQNGYESLHTTVMSPTGKWVEVQIRTKRMDEIAEKGLAAHWKYKENDEKTSGFDKWINQIRELIESQDNNALDFVDDFKMNLFAEEIFVFTPKGELKNLPANSTALDFAFEIHSEVGAKCIGAKVNQKLVPLSHRLNSGDQIEIITSHKQAPKEDWLNYVVTSKARNKIKWALKEEERKIADEGREILRRKLDALKVDFDEENITEIVKLYGVNEHTQLFVQIANDKIDLKKIKSIVQKGGRLKYASITKTIKESFEALYNKVAGKKEELVIGDASTKMDYTLAQCCTPVPGDKIFGFITINEGIKIHRTNCPNAKQMMANYAYRVINARWSSQEKEFLTGVKFTGIDNMGIVQQITTIISAQQHVNMKSISFDSNDGIFEGKIMLFITNTSHLYNLMNELKAVEGIKNIDRIELNESSGE
jgi:GTP diphosphokinase / guanosine-3',5'-bis(diphosphate) 3'-diphosphatase